MATHDDQTSCRRTERGEKRCERVRAVAAELFLKHGYDGVSLDDIIAQSGGSKTNIYSHFGGKEGLFISIVERLCDDVNASLKMLDLSNSNLEDGLRELGLALERAILDKRHLALYRLVIGQSERFPDIGRPWMEHGPNETRKTLTRFLDGHRRRLRGVTPEQAATILHKMLTWDYLNRAVFGVQFGVDSSDIEKYVDDTLALFIQGYIQPDELTREGFHKSREPDALRTGPEDSVTALNPLQGVP